MEIRLPRLGEGASSGVVASILIKEGDTIKKDQTILELESEKAVASIPSPEGGIVQKVHVKEGDELKVGDLILTVSQNGGAQPQQERSTPARERTPVKEPATLKAVPEPEAVTPGELPRESEFPPPAAPSIRRIARDLGIDLRRVKGSERGGRILLTDLRRYIEGLQRIAFAKTTPLPRAEAHEPVAIDFARWGATERKRMSQIRRTIAQRMVSSWTTIPHVTQFDEVDITHLNTLRKKHTSAYAAQGANLTLTPIIIRCLVNALQEFPMFNCSIDEVTGEVVYKQYYSIGIAVDTEQGLLVPVLRNANTKSLVDISKELEDLARRARARTISLDEMQGSTFTISNQGGIGGAHFTPIVNKPEVAILGIGRSSVKPVYRGRTPEPRMMLPLGLSYDHRAIDGADAARFIKRFGELIAMIEEKDIALGRTPAKKTTAGKKSAKKGKR